MQRLGASLALALTVAGVGVWLWSSSATYSLEKPSEVGRYQTAVVGSQTRLFAGCFLIDSMTGKTWATTITNGRAQEWREIQEDVAKAPVAATEPGRYRVSTSYVSDTIGQETGTTVRVDTITGEMWLMVLAPLPWRWTSMALPQSAAKK